MSRARARADRIRKAIPITSVLASYGYAVHEGQDRQQQFSCDLHGDGQDSKPSARVYPETQQWYCFACATSRDAIQTVREKENLDFRGACDVLESRFKLPPLPWTSEDGEEPEGGRGGTSEDLFFIPPPTAQEGKERVRKLLLGITQEKALALKDTLLLWEEFDRLCSFLEKDPEGLLDEFMNLRNRVVRTISQKTVSS